MVDWEEGNCSASDSYHVHGLVLVIVKKKSNILPLEQLCFFFCIHFELQILFCIIPKLASACMHVWEQTNFYLAQDNSVLVMYVSAFSYSNLPIF